MDLRMCLTDSFIEEYRAVYHVDYGISNSKLYADNRVIRGIYNVRLNKNRAMCIELLIKEYLLDNLMPRWRQYWLATHNVTKFIRMRMLLSLNHEDSYFDYLVDCNLFFKSYGKRVIYEIIDMLKKSFCYGEYYRGDDNNQLKILKINNLLTNFSVSNFYYTCEIFISLNI
jgi:hypothetical protein